MTTTFNPDQLHAVARLGVGLPSLDETFRVVTEELARRFPQHVTLGNPWIFNNAGGAMGQVQLLHCSLTECVMLFGTPLGTEGHSGRHRAELYGFMLAGEMWSYQAGEFERSIYRAGDATYLGPRKSKAYTVPAQAWMLGYARGLIPAMLPFGLADTILSTLDPRAAGHTVWQYGKLATKELAQGKL